jgi:hypothetical protein
MTPPAPHSKRWHAAIEAAGFHRARNGHGFCHNGTSLTCDDRWLSLRTLRGATAETLLNGLGNPGLWKTVALNGGQRVGREFHLPMTVLDSVRGNADVDDQEGDNPFEACVRWAQTTVARERPRDWTSPPPHQIDTWVQPADLVVQSGSLLTQGKVIHTPDQLAISFPVVNELPAGLSAARRDWLRGVLADAANRWRMVRVGFNNSQPPAVAVEFDFSGAPAAVLEDLVKAGLDAVRLVTLSILWPVVLLCDLNVPSRMWDEPATAAPGRRKETENEHDPRSRQ